MTLCRWVVRGLLHPVRGKGRGRGKQLFTRAELERFLREEGGQRWWQ